MKIIGLPKLPKVKTNSASLITPENLRRAGMSLSQTLAQTNIEPPSALSLKIREIVGAFMKRLDGCFVSWR